MVRKKTVVDGGGTNRCFSTYGLKLTNSVVRGFTFRNGSLPKGAGGATYGGTEHISMSNIMVLC